MGNLFLFIGCARKKTDVEYMGNEKNRGWLGYVGDYTTQLYRDYN